MNEPVLPAIGQGDLSYLLAKPCKPVRATCD